MNPDGGVLLACVVAGVLGVAVVSVLLSRLLSAPLTEARTVAFGDSDESTHRRAAERLSDLQQLLEALPQTLQDMIRVESDLQAMQQQKRGHALSDQQSAWRETQGRLMAERDRHFSAEIDRLARAFAALPRHSAVSPAPSLPTVARQSSSVNSSPAPSPAASSARPPESFHLPKPQPAPDYAEEIPARELTDEELDAMPAELPSARIPVRRMLAAPKKPTLNQL